MKKNIVFTETYIKPGVVCVDVSDTDTGRVLAIYWIVDHSTEQGTMYLVSRGEDITKTAWVYNIVQALAVCQEDYMARG